jgi:hypothetical protein
MSQKSGPRSSAEQHVREIRRQTRKQYSAEEKIRIVLEGLRGEYSIAELPVMELCNTTQTPCPTWHSSLTLQPSVDHVRLCRRASLPSAAWMLTA